ncbi:MAG TPA: hypothetical protein DCL35_02990 [Candidatus Omnitrophica bacterium]|nr:hypothetical protein [Candidatus Omnitrophota bacterium]
MISLRSGFKFFDRGFGKTLVLVPGWATDYRIFSGMELDYNYLLAQEIRLSSFVEDLNKVLEQCHLEKVSLLGYSLGGFLAKDFAVSFPKKIYELILVSIRKNYGANELDGVRRKLEKNKRAFLSGFYRDCFSASDEGRLWFAANLLKSYIDDMPIEGLLEGLDYLSTTSIGPKAFSALEKIRIFHGEEDRIAPFEEARGLASELPRARFIGLPKMGHIPFLNSGFCEKFNNG